MSRIRKLVKRLAQPDRQQVPTVPTTSEAIMRDPAFARGVAEVRAGVAFDPDCGSWNYERGRLFAACCALEVFVDEGKTLNPVAVRVLDLAFDRQLIL
jgi:hypothetical protein